MKAGARGSPTCDSDVYVRTGVWGCLTVRRMWSQCSVSWYFWCSDLVWYCGRYASTERILDPVLGVSRAMAIYGWYGGGIRRGFMVV